MYLGNTPNSNTLQICFHQINFFGAAGGGYRTGDLFPLVGYANQSDLSSLNATIYISFYVDFSSANDTLNYVNNNVSEQRGGVTITEIPN